MCTLARGFSWQLRITEFTSLGYASPLGIYDTRIYLDAFLQVCPSITTDWYGYLPASPHRLTTTREGPTQPRKPIDPKASGDHGFGWLVPLIHQGRTHTGTGISTRCPSTTPVGLALGPDLPWADQLDPGTLSQSAHTFPTCVSLLMPAFSLVYRPRLASAAASPGTRRSPTHPRTR